MFRVFAYNDQDEKLEVFRSRSLEEAVHVASGLYSASDLEYKVLNSKEQSLVVFIKPRLD